MSVYTQIHMYRYTHVCKYFMYVCHFPQPLILATTRLRARCQLTFLMYNFPGEVAHPLVF